MSRIPVQLKDAYKSAVKSGWVIERDGHDHLVWRNPDGRQFTTSGSNIGSQRSVRNYLSGLKRAGLAIPSQRRPPKKKRQNAAA